MMNDRSRAWKSYPSPKVAAMAPLHKILEQCRVSPPPNSAARPSLPLTFFDLVFFRFHPVQRLLFYESPLSKSHFLNSELPKLKQSLALTLHHFYPLAGSLTRPSGGQKPEILCSDDDFVRLTVAASDGDFYELAGNHAQNVRRFHYLVPLLHSSGDRQAVLAIQATIFPNAGIVVGTTLHHAVADGSTYANFMKAWASMHKFGGQAAELAGWLPLYDRSVIKDSKGLKGIFLKDLQSLEGDRSLEAWDLDGRPNIVRATFTFRRDHLESLKRRVASKTSAQCSPYAVACGFVWAGLVRARGETSKKKEHFGFVTGCRARLDPPIPSNYFGNCLGICCVEAKRSELIGDDGALIAADAIWKVIKSLEEGAFMDAENWIRNVYNYASMRSLTVAGSPKLGMYEVDFGWGRPKKVEVISIERTGSLSLAESREDKGGIEVGLALPSHEMEEFVSFYLNGLSELA